MPRHQYLLMKLETFNFQLHGTLFLPNNHGQSVSDLSFRLIFIITNALLQGAGVIHFENDVSLKIFVVPTYHICMLSAPKVTSTPSTGFMVVGYVHNHPNLIEDDVIKEEAQLLNTMFQVQCAM